MSLRTRLIVAFALVVLPLVGSAAYFHYTHYRQNRDMAIAEQRTIAELLARSVDVFMRRVIVIQQSVGQALVVGHWREPGSAHRYLKAVLGSTLTLEQLAFATPSGVITEAAPQALVGRDVADTSYFSRIRGGADWTVGTLAEETLVGKPGVVVATSVRDGEGRLQGVVISGISESRLGAVTRPVAGSEAGLLVLDRRGYAVYLGGGLRESARTRDFSRFPLVKKALAGETVSSMDFVLPSGKRVVGALVPIPALGWAAGAFVPRGEIVGPVVAGTVRDVLITFAVIVMAVALASLLTRRVTRQLSGLAETAERLGRGDLQVRAAVPDTAEFAALAQTMNRMADSILERDTAVRQALAGERKSAREASALYGIADSLIGTLLLHDRLQALSDGMAALAGAQVCVFHILEEDQLTVGAVSGLGGTRADSFAERKLRYYDLAGPAGAALRSGQPAVVSAPDRSLEMLTIGDTESALVLPVRGDADLLGVAVLYTPKTRSEFSEDVIATEKTLAQLARRAILESRSFEREQRIASVLQHTLLGRAPREVGRVEIATGYFPVREEAEVGGDLYDVTVLPNGLLGLMIADVSGKGLKAATNTAMVKYLVEGFSYHDHDPSRVLSKVNDVVCSSVSEWTFTTAFFGVLDTATGELVYANAGHPAPLVRESGGETNWLDVSPGLPLGVARGAGYPEASATLRTNDAVLLYTDGVIEARRNGQWFGSEGLEQSVRSIGATPDEIVEGVYRTVADFVGGRLQDDIALVAVRMRKRESSTATAAKRE